MEYNSTKEKITMREYGRNIQQLIDFAIKMKDDEKRKDAVYSIIEMMAQLNPQVRNIEDYRHKLWDHLHLIADFKTKIEAPYPLPEKETFFKRPARLKYPRNNIRYRHYGKYIDALITRAVAETDLEKRGLMTEMIGNLMKQVFNNSQKENLNDEVVKNDLEIMSGGVLKLDEEANLNLLQRSNRNNNMRDSNPTNARSNRRDFRKSGNNRSGNNRNRNQGRKKY